MQTQKRLKILAVDDTEAARRLYTSYLTPDFEIVTASNGPAGLEKAANQSFDLYIVDLMMPGMNGIEFIRALRIRQPKANVLVVSQTENLDMAINAFREHPCDFLRKPVEKTLLKQTIRRITEVHVLQDALAAAHRETACPPECPEPVIGRSASMQRLWEGVSRIANSPMCRSVLLTGESGTGKEIIARQIHRQASVLGGPFIAVNCGLLRAELAGSELLGIEKGTATGVDPRKGKIEIAHGGTLFLDEISELPPDVQPMLLRVLQDRLLTPIGGHSERPVDVRVIAATNRDMTDAVRSGRFREDLYYRIAAIRLEIPPLRNRRDDIPDLVDHLFRRHGGRGPVPFDQSEIERLQRFDWPGNIRQLENLVIQKMVLGDIPDVDPIGSGAPLMALEAAVATLADGRTFSQIRDLIFSHVLAQCGGSMSRAAHRLDVSRSTIWEFTKRPKSIG